MKIVGTYDLHGYLVDLCDMNSEQFDVLCICGDIVPLKIQTKMNDSKEWFMNDFTEWALKVACDRVIFIAGNHDRFLEKMLKKHNYNAAEVSKELDWPEKLVFLHDSSYEYMGKTFYGTPWCPDLYQWAFFGDHDQLNERFSHIPKECDVLLTHSPGKMMFDTGTVLQYYSMEEFGSMELTEAVMMRKIGLWMCGHVHSGNHDLNTFTDRNFACYDMKVTNVSLKDERYEPTYKLFRIEI